LEGKSLSTFDEDAPVLRDAPAVSSRRAESDLFRGLHEAAKSLENTDDYGRKNVIAALKAVGVFLYGRGARSHLMQPFTLLENAFADLEREDAQGRVQVPELFRPKPVDSQGDPVSAQSQSYLKRKIKLCAAACMERKMQLGESKKVAAANVARATDKWPKIDLQTINGTTIVNWRRMYLNLSRDDPDHKDFQYLIDEFNNDETGSGFFANVFKHGPSLTGGLNPR
jgi:hypothetical protein